jgi:hypothetical protein
VRVGQGAGQHRSVRRKHDAARSLHLPRHSVPRCVSWSRGTSGTTSAGGVAEVEHEVPVVLGDPQV